MQSVFLARPLIESLNLFFLLVTSPKMKLILLLAKNNAETFVDKQANYIPLLILFLESILSDLNLTTKTKQNFKLYRGSKYSTSSFCVIVL